MPWRLSSEVLGERRGDPPVRRPAARGSVRGVRRAAGPGGRRGAIGVWGTPGRRGWVGRRRVTTTGSDPAVTGSTMRRGEGLDLGLPGSPVAAGVRHRLGVDFHVQDVCRHLGLNR